MSIPQNFLTGMKDTKHSFNPSTDIEIPNANCQLYLPND